MILLEEPEWSLHKAVVEQIPDLLYMTRKRKPGQALVSAHSEAMLSSKSLDANFLMLQLGQGGEATKIIPPSDNDIQAMRSGLSAADILLPQTAATIQSF